MIQKKIEIILLCKCLVNQQGGNKSVCDTINQVLCRYAAPIYKQLPK